MSLENYPSIEQEEPIQIFSQSSEDVVGATNVYYQAWLATYPNEERGVTREDVETKFANSFSEESMQKRREYIENQHENELSLVAKDNGKVIGVCAVTREDEVNRLRSIYILPEYQGKGVGSQLWEEARKFLDSEKATIVEVVDYNESAIGFYKAKGFKETGNQRQDEKFRMSSGAIFTEIEMKRRPDKEV